MQKINQKISKWIENQKCSQENQTTEIVKPSNKLKK